MKFFFLTIILSMTFSVFAFEPLYYSIDKLEISKEKRSEKDLVVIDLTDIHDFEDIEDNVKIRNNTKTLIEKVSIYATGDFIAKQSTQSFIVTNNFAWVNSEANISGVDKIEGLFLLGNIKDIKPGKVKWWRTKLEDKMLGQFRFIIIDIEKPRELNWKITDVKESFDDLLITIE